MGADNPDAPECPDCLRSGVLCFQCRRTLLPQLAQPAWRFLIGRKRKPVERVPDPSVAAVKAERRNQRKRLRAAMRSGPRGLALTLALTR